MTADIDALVLLLRETDSGPLSDEAEARVAQQAADVRRERYLQDQESAAPLSPGALVVGRRAWAAMMLARTVDAWRAILAGEKVPSRHLDRAVYARTTKWLPRSDRPVLVTSSDLDLIQDVGGFVPKAPGRSALREPRYRGEGMLGPHPLFDVDGNRLLANAARAAANPVDPEAPAADPWTHLPVSTDEAAPPLAENPDGLCACGRRLAREEFSGVCGQCIAAARKTGR